MRAIFSIFVLLLAVNASAQRYAITNINFGTAANDGTGDTPRSMAQKINTNFWSVTNVLRGIQIDIRSIGAACDGETDDASYIQLAVNSLTNGGGRVFIPARTVINSTVTITNDNVTLSGPGAGMVYSTAIATNLAWLTHATNVTAFRVGDDSRTVKGFSIQNATMYAPNNGSRALWIQSGWGGYYQNLVLFGYKTNIMLGNGTNYPATLNEFYGTRIEQSSEEGSRAIYSLWANDEDAYVTANRFFGGEINGRSSGTDVYAIEIDASELMFIGTYVDGTSGRMVKMTKTASAFGYSPLLQSSGMWLDASGGGVVVDVDNSATNGWVWASLKGWFQGSGNIRQTGVSYPINNINTASFRTYAPKVDSGIYLSMGSTLSNTGNIYIDGNSDASMTLYSPTYVTISGSDLNVTRSMRLGTGVIANQSTNLSLTFQAETRRVYALVTNNPTDGDTLVINGETKTWKTATTTNYAAEILIGANTNASATNLSLFATTNLFYLTASATAETNQAAIVGSQNAQMHVSSTGTWGSFQLVTNNTDRTIVDATTNNLSIVSPNNFAMVSGVGGFGFYNGSTQHTVLTHEALTIPRVTTTQRDAIASPANGMLIYNTSTTNFQGRAGGAWVNLN